MYRYVFVTFPNGPFILMRVKCKRSIVNRHYEFGEEAVLKRAGQCSLQTRLTSSTITSLLRKGAYFALCSHSNGHKDKASLISHTGNLVDQAFIYSVLRSFFSKRGTKCT